MRRPSLSDGDASSCTDNDEEHAGLLTRDAATATAAGLTGGLSDSAQPAAAKLPAGDDRAALYWSLLSLLLSIPALIGQ